GFGTGEEIRTYESYARSFDPDVIVFQWHDSDFKDNVRSGLYRLEQGKLVPGRASYLPSVDVQDRLMRSSVYRFVADNSHLYSFTREKAAKLTKRTLVMLRRSSQAAASGDDEDDDARAAPEAPRAYDLALAEALLDQAQAEVKADGRAFYIVEIP